MARRAAIGPEHPVPTSRPVWNTKTRQRGLLKASWTAAKRLGAKYALLQRAPIACRSSGSLSPEPATGMASANVTTLTKRGTKWRMPS